MYQTLFLYPYALSNGLAKCVWFYYTPRKCNIKTLSPRPVDAKAHWTFSSKNFTLLCSNDNLVSIIDSWLKTTNNHYRFSVKKYSINFSPRKCKFLFKKCWWLRIIYWYVITESMETVDTSCQRLLWSTKRTQKDEGTNRIKEKFR